MTDDDEPPASPSIYVIVLCITAVFKKPLSATRKPFLVSFSSRSPGFAGEDMALKAVAGMLLSLILLKSEVNKQNNSSSGGAHGMVYVFPVRLSRTVRFSLSSSNTLPIAVEGNEIVKLQVTRCGFKSFR
jgi:hypothetical protein